MIPDWVTSDSHFGHLNIIKYAGRPDNHEHLMIERWQQTVGPTDTVLHCGDVLMGRRDLWPIIPRLPGTVHVLDSGNHDEPHKRKWMEETWGWAFIPEYEIRYKGWVVKFSHYPLGTQERADATDNTHVDVVKPLGKKTINIHGHCHSAPPVSPRHVNVCVEHTGYAPVRLEKLLDDTIARLEA